jgi:dihydropteroate synthase
MAAVLALLGESHRLALAAGIPAERIVVDPGIGFFRRQALPWHEWDCRVLAELHLLRQLERPICVGVSRKSFIGALSGQPDPGARLPGSLAATAAAVLGGAHLIRCHDVAETIQAVRVAQAIRNAGEGR